MSEVLKDFRLMFPFVLQACIEVFNNLVELIDLNYLLEAFNHQVTSKLCQLLGPNTLLSPVTTRS